MDKNMITYTKAAEITRKEKRPQDSIIDTQYHNYNARHTFFKPQIIKAAVL